MSAEEQEALEVRQIASTCRFYEKEYPDVHEVVIVTIGNIETIGVTVTLPEYNNIEGMIFASEVSRRRFRSIKAVFNNIKTMACTVVRVDDTKGYIDLSKKRVSPGDSKVVEERYAMSRNVHSILARVAYLTKTKLEDLYKSFGWDLYKRFGHAYHAFNQIANGDLSILEQYTIRADVLEHLTTIIKQKMSPKPSTIYAKMEVSCYGPKGVEGIKEAFRAGVAVSNDIKLNIRVVGPPFYVISTTTSIQSVALKVVEQAIEAIKEVLEANQGKIVIPNGIKFSNKDIDLDSLAKDQEDDKDGEDDDEDDEDEDDYDEDDEDY